MTSNVASPQRKTEGVGRQLSSEQAAAAAMVAEARGLELTGSNGLLKLFTKRVLETALNEEGTEHLGHEKKQAELGRESADVRNGSRGRSVISDAAGDVRIDVPRDRGRNVRAAARQETAAAVGRGRRDRVVAVCERG